MKVMWCRSIALQQTIDGWSMTHLPLIEHHGKEFFPAAVIVGDDLGAYYFIPKIALLFHLPLQTAIDVFYIGSILGAAILGILGILLLFKTPAGRLIGVLYLLAVAYLAYRIGDIYTVSYACIAAVIPLFLYFAMRSNRKKDGEFPYILIWMFISGMIAEFSNWIRFHSGTGVFIFMLVVLFFYCKWTPKQKIAGLACIAAGFLVPQLMFGHLIAERNAFFKTHPTQYMLTSDHHPIWQQLFIGLGFLANPYSLYYDDLTGYNRIHEIDPKAVYHTEHYQQVAKFAFFRILRLHPHFAVLTFAAKAGVVMFYTLACMNFGAPAALRRPKERGLELAFWSAMGFNMLFGILVIPWPSYLLGLFTFASFYGSFSIDEALQNRMRIRLRDG